MLDEVPPPKINLLENVVQPFDEIHPVVSHPDSAKVLLDRSPHLVETVRYVGLGESPHDIWIGGFIELVGHEVGRVRAVSIVRQVAP